MRIYEMTATFGKLEHETLTLKPGLNIIEAPNEWGKSTWCAFLMAMFYGVDTRAKTTRTALSEKEHYAPWSGAPMSGRIRLDWNGKDITIQRSTRGRIPLGEFSAYETESGLPVPQLNAGNCGEILLGAEQSVFKRSGFVKLTDLPVTRDDALRRRLNALVTTGDESGDGEKLARDLKSLQNKCRYNKTGLLPQAEAELKELSTSLQEVRDLQAQSERISHQTEEENENLWCLQNHLTHLGNREASQDAARVRQAQLEREKAEKELSEARDACRGLPPLETIQGKKEKIQNLSFEKEQLLEQEQAQSGDSAAPQPPAAFAGLTATEALETARSDAKLSEFLQLNILILWILMAVCAFAGAILLFALHKIPGALLCLALTGGLLACGFFYQKARKEKLAGLQNKYGSSDPEKWIAEADLYMRTVQVHGEKLNRARILREERNARLEYLKKRMGELCGDRSAAETLEKLNSWEQMLLSLSQKEKQLQQAKAHLGDVMAMAKKTRKTDQEDGLFYSEEETKQRILASQKRKQELISRIGQYQGRMESLGTEAQLLRKQEQLETRIRKLEDFYEALAIAQSHLEEAAAELQRRFAPRITRRTQELMSRMTGGKYEKLTLQEDFSLQVGTQQEDTLHSVLWRSEGTMDQLYLSLRLAVAEALTPEAPLILDDALVRFDQNRLERALDILLEEEEHKQVILFTCQSREGEYLPQALTRKEGTENTISM